MSLRAGLERLVTVWKYKSRVVVNVKNVERVSTNRHVEIVGKVG